MVVMTCYVNQVIYLGNTSGSTGQIAGEQVFGPYGEQMAGTFNGKTLPSGYRPITGYTGHINEDSTGLIYMRDRYYSPKWHRFINSDQGVDPNSINQFAYVNGMPFMATDPSGMNGNPIVLDFKITVEVIGYPDKIDYYIKMQNLRWWLISGGDRLEISDPGPRNGGGGGSGAGSSSGSGQNAQQAANKEQKTDCEKYADALVAHASDYRFIPFGKNLFGADLAYRAATDRGRGSFGLAPNWSDFKERLVNGGQKSGVYRHISAAVGTSLALGGGIGGLSLPAATAVWDLGEYIFGHSEGMAEMYGDLAGAVLVPGFNMYFGGILGSESLKNYITSALCDK